MAKKTKFIRESVGQGGINKKEDVKVVQELLNQFAQFWQPQMAKLAENGVAGSETIKAIRIFQKDFVRMTSPDGRVDPGGKTIIFLGGLPKGRKCTPNDDNIDSKIAAFETDINTRLEVLSSAKQAEIDSQASGTSSVTNPFAKMIFKKSENPVDALRSPKAQAVEVSDGDSMVCWSAHMADKARHVFLYDKGKIVWSPKDYLSNDVLVAIKEIWGGAMKDNCLKNARGLDGWYSSDIYHLELTSSKIKDRNDPRVQSCLDEYARLTRKKDKPKNTDFETQYADLLKPHIDKYEKEEQAPTITGSVGRGGDNNTDDVRIVQELLNNFRQPPLEQLEVNGISGPKLIEAIETFQVDLVKMDPPDGRVDPGKKTITALLGGAG